MTRRSVDRRNLDPGDGKARPYRANEEIGLELVAVAGCLDPPGHDRAHRPVPRLRIRNVAPGEAADRDGGEAVGHPTAPRHSALPTPCPDHEIGPRKSVKQRRGVSRIVLSV